MTFRDKQDTFCLTSGVRLILTGAIIVGVITLAGGAEGVI